MNTVEKGNIFEGKALTIIKKLIEEESILVNEKYIRIYKKKKYPSKIRPGKVEFDLTIELWPPNAERYSMIYFIECKDYKTRIPIDKVKKFHSDILEVSGVNAKGVFITNSLFQEGAYNYADSIGLMVVQAESAENFKIILTKRTELPENRISILKESLNNLLLDSGIESLEKIVDKKILESLIPNKSNVSYGINLLNKETIEEIAIQELDKLNENIITNAYGLNINVISKYLSENYNIQLKTIPSKSTVLGLCDIENKIISINQSIIGTKRHLFVLCHEFGHFILHQKLMIDQQNYNSLPDSEYNFVTSKHSLENPRQWIEWQANHFSISFLLPKTSIIAKLWEYQIKLGLPKTALYFDDQYSTQKDFQLLLNRLSYHFEISKTSIIYRLNDIGYYKNNSKVKSIGQLINEFKENFFT